MKYFAYGSNMNENRMIQRGLKPKSKEAAYIEEFEFKINKKSYKNPKIGYANIMPKKGSIVEGIVYDVSENDIKKLDKFEGYPKHYYRDYLDVKLKNGDIVKAYVYIAKGEWISVEELKTTNKYKENILKGREMLSNNYYEFLNESITI